MQPKYSIRCSALRGRQAGRQAGVIAKKEF